MRRLLLPAAVLLALAAWAPRAHAHSCDPLRGMNALQEMRDSAVVFIGTAREARPAPARPSGDVLSSDPVTYVFDVHAYWRGPVGRRTEVWSTYDGQQYQVGRTYLVYASRSHLAEFYDDKCSRTRWIERARDDLLALGPPIIPGDEPPLVGPDRQGEEYVEPSPVPEPARASQAKSRARIPSQPRGTSRPPGCSITRRTPPAFFVFLIANLLVARRRTR